MLAGIHGTQVEHEYWDNGIVRLYLTDARDLPIPDNSVDCVVTSPPYWGLRDYGTGRWIGGDECCDHLQVNDARDTTQVKQVSNAGTNQLGYKNVCGKCGAQRDDGQLGLESTPEEYCASMVEVFREAWRVLKPTGTLWLNLGDSYVGTGHKGTYTDPEHPDGRNGQVIAINNRVAGLKSKDLVGIPWRVAFALQADGWYLRSDIIWSKPNPMPESVQDRPTKAHEYVFLLTKSPRYYYDADAIREDAAWERWGSQTIGKQYRGIHPVDMNTLDDRREQGL